MKYTYRFLALVGEFVEWKVFLRSGVLSVCGYGLERDTGRSERPNYGIMSRLAGLPPIKLRVDPCPSLPHSSSPHSPWDAPSPAGRRSPRRTSPPRRGACPPARRALRPRSPRPPSRRRRRPPRPAWASCATRPDRPRRSGRTSAAGVSPRSYGGGGWALFPCFFVFVFIRSFFIGPPFQVPVRVIRSGFIARRGGVSFELVDGRREKGRRDGNSPGMLSSFILHRPPRKPNDGAPSLTGAIAGPDRRLDPRVGRTCITNVPSGRSGAGLPPSAAGGVVAFGAGPGLSRRSAAVGVEPGEFVEGKCFSPVGGYVLERDAGRSERPNFME